MLSLMLFLDCSSDHWKYEILLVCYCKAYGENSMYTTSSSNMYIMFVKLHAFHISLVYMYNVVVFLKCNFTFIKFPTSFNKMFSCGNFHHIFDL
jgi:hypothetical protein